MNQRHEVTAEEIEASFGQQANYARFANFCNSVLLAGNSGTAQSLPILSEKPGADGCFDGEWNLELQEPAFSCPFAQVGWNLFQYKARGISGGGRDKAISGLKSNMKGTLRDLIQRLAQPKAPKQYVLFTNLQLGLETESTTRGGATLSRHRKEMEAAIREGGETDAVVEIVDAAQLAAIVNKTPALRLTYFSPPNARSWEEKWREEKAAKDYKASVGLVGREKEMEKIAKWLTDDTTKVIAISGPSGMGKTRLALESTRRDQFRTTVVDVVEELDRWGLAAFATSIQPHFIIVEDPDGNQAQRLAKQAVVVIGVKLILTFPSDARTPILKLTEDESVRNLTLRPLDRQQSEKLLTAAGSRFDSQALSWVILQAGGNPEILLSAAELGQSLREKSGSLKSKLAELYSRRIEKELGRNAVDSLRLVSPLQWVGLTGNESDLRVLIVAFDIGQAQITVSDDLRSLERMGYIRRRGDHVTVVPPLFAAALTEEVLITQSGAACKLFDRLNDTARKRLLERVVTTEVSDNSPFWDHVFETAFGNGERFIANLDLLDCLARAVPGRTARFLGTQIEVLGQIHGDGEYNWKRSAILNTLKELAYQQESCADGMRILQDLALREPWEKNAQSATKLFCECFVHWFYQFPMSYREREMWVRSMLDSDDIHQRRLAARVVVTVTNSPFSLSGHSVNARKLGQQPALRLYREVWEYLENFIELRFVLSQSDDLTIAEFSQEEFVQVFQGLRGHLPLQLLVKYLERLMDWQAASKIKADESDFRLVIHWLEEECNKASIAVRKTEEATKWAEVLRRLAILRNRLDQGPFPLRLKIALGKAYDVDWEEVDGRRVYNFEKRCMTLAEEAVASPTLMADDAWANLKDPEAYQAYTFVFSLGELDKNHVFFEKFKMQVGDPHGDHIFGLYLSGVQKHDDTFVAARLDEMTTESTFPRITFLTTLLLTGPTAGNRARLLKAIANKGVEPLPVGRVFTTGGWLRELPPVEVRTILEFVATGPPECHRSIVRMLSLYLHPDKALPNELIPIAEDVVSKHDLANNNLHWDCGQIAIGIGRTDLESAFRLLHHQIATLRVANWQEAQFIWNPFGRYNSHDFWMFVRRQAPERAYRELLPLRDSETKAEFDLVNLEDDCETVLRICAENEDFAVFFARFIFGLQSGFFSFAYKLMALFPDSTKVSATLISAAASQFDFVQENHQKMLAAVEVQQHNPETPSRFAQWLEEIKRRIQEEERPWHARDLQDQYLGWD